MQRAYAPYSGFPVGAAGVVRQTDQSTRVVTGCNVENASYGLGLCAECGVVSALHNTGGGRLTALSVVGADGEPVAPCGRCRQLLFEAGGSDLLVQTDKGIVTITELLPGAFGPDDLDLHGTTKE